MITLKSSATGTHYFRAWKGTQIWNGSAYENYNAANYAAYVIATTTTGQSIYSGNVPDDAGAVELVAQAGGSPAASDPVKYFERLTVAAAATTSQVKFETGGAEFR